MKYTIPLLSAFFLGYGFMNTLFFYSSFGIRVQDYFAVGDYVSASIEHLWSFATAIAVGGALSLVWSRPPVGDSSPQERKRRSRASLVEGLVLSGVVLVGSTVALLRHIPGARYMFVMPAVILWFAIYDRVLPGWLKDALSGRSIWLVPLAFAIIPSTAAMTFSFARMRATEVKLGSRSRPVEVVLAPEVGFDSTLQRGLVVLGSNLRYYFFYSVESESVHVVPAALVRRVSSGRAVQPASPDSTAIDEPAHAPQP